MRYYCTRCGSFQEFDKVESIVRAGDNGFCKAEVWSCKQCNFTPFLPPEPEGKEDGKQRSNSNKGQN